MQFEGLWYFFFILLSTNMQILYPLFCHYDMNVNILLKTEARNSCKLPAVSRTYVAVEVLLLFLTLLWHISVRIQGLMTSLNWKFKIHYTEMSFNQIKVFVQRKNSFFFPLRNFLYSNEVSPLIADLSICLFYVK